MELLAGRPGWPSILLARAATLTPDAGVEAAEAAGAWSAWKKAVTTIAPESLYSRNSICWGMLPRTVAERFIA